MTMFQRVRKQINPAMILALVALVFAATGGAFAATGGGSGNSPAHATLTASVAKAKKKAAPKSTRGPAGPKGATGAAGPAGPAGPTGPAGAAGAKGENGAAGANGVNGVNGEKGETGPAGPQGPPGTTGFTKTLPEGETEMGTFAAISGATSEVPIPISFSIPLASAITKTHLVTVAQVTKNEIPKGCSGTSAAPAAQPGDLCVFEGVAGNFIAANILQPASASPGAGTTGAALLGATETPNETVVGTWAVTAPES